MTTQFWVSPTETTKLPRLQTLCFSAWSAAVVVKEGQVRTIYKSQTFPTTGYGHAHNLHPNLVAKVKQAFWSYDWDENFKKEFKKADRFVGITHKFDWAVIRKIDAANGVSYDCK